MNSTIAHLKPPKSNESKWEFQYLDDHSQGVATLAAEFASKFGCSKLGETLGLLHDLGKEQQGFQDYIQDVSGYKPKPKASKTPHAYVGALIAKQIYPKFFPLLSPIIMAHHRGLYDASDYEAQLLNQIPADVCERPAQTVLSLPKVSQPYELNHLVRMLFSCLVDADYLDTEQFMDASKATLRTSNTSMLDLWKKLESHLKNLQTKSPATPLNKIRQEIQQDCLRKSA